MQDLRRLGQLLLLNSVANKSNSYCQVKHTIERCSTQWLNCTLTAWLYSLPAWLSGAVNYKNREFVVVGWGGWMMV